MRNLNEVLKNIWESYPLGWISLGLAIVAAVTSFLCFRKVRFASERGFALWPRLGFAVGMAAVCSINYIVSPSEISAGLSYSEVEISKNGLHSLFSAYFSNELDYNRFYLSTDLQTSFDRVRKNLISDGVLDTDSASIMRKVVSPEKFNNHNVVLVSMESMSARFMAAYGDTKKITSNLDSLAHKGLFFSNIYSTGTRTVRGLEALVLSIPPTPGQSILRRPRNNNLYNLGDYLFDAGYKTQFLYGGNGYFDNMNAFFSSNAFEIVDRPKMSKDEVTFENAWGACDENLFAKAASEADHAFAEGKPFLQVIMTTSNHRPYTYPQNIDIPSGSGRDGAIKYSDYAIGQFIESVKSKPWFENTIFVFVADHNAAVSGNVDVPSADFRIPVIFYAPKIIPAQKVTKLGSQIDVAPTILGLLNATYNSHFFGHDLRTSSDERAFLGTYEKVGMIRDRTMTILGPNKVVEQYSIGENDVQTKLETLRQDLVEETVGFYQVASYLFSNNKMLDTGDDEITNRQPTEQK